MSTRNRTESLTFTERRTFKVASKVIILSETDLGVPSIPLHAPASEPPPCPSLPPPCPSLPPPWPSLPPPYSSLPPPWPTHQADAATDPCRDMQNSPAIVIGGPFTPPLHRRRRRRRRRCIIYHAYLKIHHVFFFTSYEYNQLSPDNIC